MKKYDLHKIMKAAHEIYRKYFKLYQLTHGVQTFGDCLKLAWADEKKRVADEEAVALGFVLIMVSRWHRRMEDKLNEIREYTRRVSDRDDVIYMNQLQWLKSKLIEEERYEEAAKINKCIEDEYNKLKNRKSEYEA